MRDRGLGAVHAAPAPPIILGLVIVAVVALPYSLSPARLTSTSVARVSVQTSSRRSSSATRRLPGELALRSERPFVP